MKILVDGAYIGIGLAALVLIALDEVWEWVRLGFYWLAISLWQWGMIAWFRTGGAVLYWRRRRRALREIERLLKDDLFLRK